MPKKNGALARRACNLLRLALLWSRKGGVFKRKILMELRLVPKYLRSSFGNTTPRDRLHYLERELSFDETPIFHVKMHRPTSMRFHLPHIPCIKPQVDFDYDFDADAEAEGYSGSNTESGKIMFLHSGDEEYYSYDYECGDGVIPFEEEGIDMRAEQFIAKFYEQVKLQRQISYRQHNGVVLDKGTS